MASFDIDTSFPADNGIVAQFPTGERSMRATLEAWLLTLSDDDGNIKQSALAGIGVGLPGLVVPYAGTTAPTGWLLAQGQAVSRTTYAALFDVIGTTYGGGDGTTTFNLPDLRGRVVAGKDNMGGTSANRLTGQTGGVNGDNLAATGGDETHTLTTAQLSSHSHSGSTNSGGSHTHTFSDTTSSSGSHTHSFSDTTNSGGSHSHDITYYLGGSDPSGLNIGAIGSTGSTGTISTKSGGSHTHSFSGTTNSGGSHTHSVSGTTGSGGSHTHSFTTNAAGSGDAHNNVQPTIILNYLIKT